MNASILARMIDKFGILSAASETIMNNKSIYRYKMLSTITSFTCIFVALISVANAQATGYELSIYSATPSIFWIAIIFSLSNGILLIASDVYQQKGKLWIVGLFQILFSNCLVISLYALRGYICLGGDPLSLIGLAKDIYNYGFFGQNYYPISSILIASFSQVMGVSVILISNYLSSLFFIIYILSIYCWSKFLIHNRTFVLCSLIASVPIFFSWYTPSIYPMLLSVFTIPFFFYCLQRNKDYRFRLFSIIWCIVYPFFHPFTAVMIFIYLTTIFICERWWPRLDEKSKQISTTLIIFSFVPLSAWFTWQYTLLKSFKRIIFQFLSILKTPTTLAEAQYFLSELGIMVTLRSFIFMVGDDIIYYLIVSVAFVLILKDGRFKKKFIPLIICFIVGSFFILICSLFAYVQSPIRFINSNSNMMLTPPLVGYLVYNFLINNKRAKTFLVLSLIFISAVTAIISLYTSPLIMYPNNQVTISDIKGMEWLISLKNPELSPAGTSSAVHRFADLIYGLNFRKGRSDLLPLIEIPYHFGFTDKNIFPIEEDIYLVVRERHIVSYTEVLKDIDRFAKEDFIKVDYCTNVDKIYENGEFRSYFVYKDG